MKLKLALGLAVAAAVAVFAVGPFNNVATAQMSENWKPKWTADGKLKLPEGFREWVFLGAPLTPHALNDGKAGFPEYHNVYIHPEAYKIYKATGEFPEGTILLKELQLTKKGEEKDGSRTETSGRGYFPAAFNGIDISVKDSKRFSETQNWGYFNFGIMRRLIRQRQQPPRRKPVLPVTLQARPRIWCSPNSIRCSTPSRLRL